MKNWIEAITELSRQDKSFVIVTILSVQGSSPRDAETKMVVEKTNVYDTIGGGNLEFQAIHQARAMLSSRQPAVVRNTVTLGKDLAQCCGGKVELLFEYIPAQACDVVLFGAGHVGQALVRILCGLDCRITWLDSRDEFIEAGQRENSGADIEIIKMRSPEIAVEACPGNAYYLVMTHSHVLDMQLVEAILSRDDVRFCGLIGSESKAAKFRNRLARKQFSKPEIARLTSPIGLAQVTGKRPMEIAVSIAGQLIALWQSESQSLQGAQHGTAAETRVNRPRLITL